MCISLYLQTFGKINDIDGVGSDKAKHPNKGHTPNRGQRPIYIRVSVIFEESKVHLSFTDLVYSKTRDSSDMLIRAWYVLPMRRNENYTIQ